MIDSFFVKNFKNLKRLELPGLKRINLFTGKNNTGKSTLLEALALYVNDGDVSIIKQLLLERGEIIGQSGPKGSVNKTPLRKGDVDTLSSLFTDRKIGYDFLNDSIVLSQIKANLFTEIDNTNDELRIGFVKFIDEHTETNDGVIKKRKFITDEIEAIQNEDDINLGLQILVNGEGNVVRIGDYHLYRRLSNPYRTSESLESHPFQLIKSGLASIENSSYLWDQITLTEKEQFVIEALQIIEPTIQRIAYIGESSRDRTAVVKIKDNEKVVPLKSMGDGINRILTIILAAVNCSNGYLLIDEFENGLHHSVQEQLWRILIHLSASLNLQIFATTHSNDCIDGFENAIGSSADNSIGRLFRLEKDKNDSINIVPFNIDEVKIATEEHIEIR